MIEFEVTPDFPNGLHKCKWRDIFGARHECNPRAVSDGKNMTDPAREREGRGFQNAFEGGSKAESTASWVNSGPDFSASQGVDWVLDSAGGR